METKDRTPQDAGRPRRIRYRAGLGVIVGLLLTLTVTAIAWATFFNTRRAIIELTNQRIDEILFGLGTRVQNHMLAAVPAIELSAMLVSESLVKADRDALARQFTAVLRANPFFSWASYSDRDGGFTGAYRTAAGELHVSQTTIDSKGGEMRDYAVGERGAWSHPASQHNYGYDPRSDSFYRQVEKTRKRTWIGPYVFFDEGVPGITCAAPNLRRDGSMGGVFTIDFNLNFLSRFVGELHFSEHGRVFILAPDGKVIADPKLQLVETTGKGYEGKIVTVADVADPVLQAFHAAIPAEIRTRTSPAPAPARTQFGFTLDGRRYLAGCRILDIDQGLTWMVGAAAPESDFTGVLDRNRLATVVITLVALAAGLAISLVVARQITRPLSNLASEMGEIGRFHLLRRPRMKTIFKEVALMDESLLSMKGSLRSFSYYVPTDLVRTMLASGQEATLQGQTRELTVYFSDIAGFTSLAEGVNPDQLVQHLARYLDEMTKIVASTGGTVDKFIGDAIMAFWGAPVNMPDHAARACCTAVLAQRKLAAMRSEADTQWPAKLHARIGVATGEMLVGNIGSPERFNYTVMGDTVNLASRLEGLNKLYGTSILIGESTFQSARASIVARPIDIVLVKGKQRQVKVYEPLCLSDEQDPAARSLASLFEEGLHLYLRRDFKQAAGCYERALQLCPGDRPAAVLLERSREYVLSPPGDEWDGVFAVGEK